MKLRIEWTGRNWAALIPGSTRRVNLDSAVVDVERHGPGWVEGRILSSQGISQEDAVGLNGDALRTLGIGAQLRHVTETPSWITRCELTVNGAIEKQ